MTATRARLTPVSSPLHSAPIGSTPDTDMTNLSATKAAKAKDAKSVRVIAAQAPA